MIRRAVLEDMEAIFRVHTSAVRRVAGYYSPSEIEVWSGRRSPETFAKAVASKVVLVEEDTPAIRGFAQLDLEASVIEAIYVVPAYWRRGVGSRLLAELESVARAAGKRDLTLDASLNAVAFYEAAGYTRIADSTHQLCVGTSIGCVVMQKRLHSAA